MNSNTELYPDSEVWELRLKEMLKRHQAPLLKCDYAGIIPIDIERGDYLVTTTDGIGTKILLAETAEDYFNLGIDNVAMNVNDLICTGATPKAFTNVLSRSFYNPLREMKLMEGMIYACEQSGMILAAGETADVPDLIDGFDLTGNAVGTLNIKNFINGKMLVQENDFIYGVKSSGPHSNGLTLIRKYYKDFSDDLQKWVKSPTVLYTQLPSITYHGMAHITGGGLRKLNRIIPEHLYPQMEFPPLTDEWKELLERLDCPLSKARDIFNLGIGMIFITPQEITLSKEHESLVFLGQMKRLN